MFCLKTVLSVGLQLIYELSVKSGGSWHGQEREGYCAVFPKHLSWDMMLRLSWLKMLNICMLTICSWKPELWNGLYGNNIFLNWPLWILACGMFCFRELAEWVTQVFKQPSPVPSLPWCFYSCKPWVGFVSAWISGERSTAWKKSFTGNWNFNFYGTGHQGVIQTFICCTKPGVC